MSENPECISHPVETDEDIAAATGEDVHDESRFVFPEQGRFTDEEWAFIEAARTGEAS